MQGTKIMVQGCYTFPIISPSSPNLGLNLNCTCFWINLNSTVLYHTQSQSQFRSELIAIYHSSRHHRTKAADMASICRPFLETRAIAHTRARAKPYVKVFCDGVFLPACICMELGRWFKIFQKTYKVDDVRNYIITNKILFFEKRG